MSDENTVKNSDEILEFYKHNLLIAYQGVFERTLLSVIAGNIETSVKDFALSKKMFRVFVELAQNISFFSDEKVKTEEGFSGKGIILLKVIENGYIFATGNMIENEKVNHLKESCDHINTLNREILRQYKREQLEKVQNARNTNLGFIQVALLTGNKIFYNLKEINKNYSFITISAKILSI